MSVSSTRIDKGEIPTNRDEIRLFMVCRNEELRLPWVLDYYKKAGVDRMFIVDNGSTDRTQEILLHNERVHVFYTDGSYKNSAAGMLWINELLDVFGVDQWCVVVDADEILIYPHCEFLSLPEFCRYLDGQHARAVFTLMIDMYSKGPVKDAIYSPGQSFFDVADCFDTGPYFVFPMQTFPFLHVRGGMRKRAFWPETPYNEGPQLTKVPLVKWQLGMRYKGSTHVLEPAVNLADVTGALLHFKYFSDFADFAKQEFERNDRPHIHEYRMYYELFRENPDVSFFCNESVLFDGSGKLASLGLIRVPYDYVAHAQSVVAKRAKTPEKLLSKFYGPAASVRVAKPRVALDLLGLFAPIDSTRKK